MIEVGVRYRTDRKYLQLWYRDPFTGRIKTKSAGTDSPRKAERAAAEWQAELAESQGATDRVSWDCFRRRMEDEFLIDKAPRSRPEYRHAMDKFERYMGRPKELSSITPAVLSSFAAKLRKDMSPATTAKVLRHLHAGMRWAHRAGLLAIVPRFPSVRVKPKGKGRPVKADEFPRLLAACQVVAEYDFEPRAYQRIYCGWWLSGLRFKEAMRLSWDSGPVRVDLDGAAYPRIIWRADGHKAGRNETSPITPCFTALLRATPPTERSGWVFTGLSRNDANRFLFAEIGRASGVVVNEAGQHAMPHDLRRSFATRWAPRVMPAVLRALMRHRSIETTMQYYADIESDEIAAALWQRNVHS